MYQRIHIICNLKAGNGKGQEVLNQVRQILDDYRLTYLTYFPKYSTHAKLLAQQIVSRWQDDQQEQLLVIGGDGTLHEVVESLFEAAMIRPLAYLPAGAANDFHQTWQRNKEPRDIIQSFLFHPQITDLPIFAYEERIGNLKGIALNSIGFGFNAQVSLNASKYRQSQWFNQFPFLARLSYRLSAFQSCLSLPHYRLKAQLDGQDYQWDQVHEILVSNTPYFAGGIQFNPYVQKDESALALRIGHSLKKNQTFDLIAPINPWRKKINPKPNFVHLKASQSLRLQIDEFYAAQIDGEYFSNKALDMEISLAAYPFYL